MTYRNENTAISVLKLIWWIIRLCFWFLVFTPRALISAGKKTREYIDADHSKEIEPERAQRKIARDEPAHERAQPLTQTRAPALKQTRPQDTAQEKKLRSRVALKKGSALPAQPEKTLRACLVGILVEGEFDIGTVAAATQTACGPRQIMSGTAVEPLELGSTLPVVLNMSMRARSDDVKQRITEVGSALRMSQLRPILDELEKAEKDNPPPKKGKFKRKLRYFLMEGTEAPFVAEAEFSDDMFVLRFHRFESALRLPLAVDSELYILDPAS